MQQTWERRGIARTEGSAITARSVEGQASVSMGGSAETARSAEGVASVVKAVVTTFGLVGKRLRESNLGAHLDCEVPLEDNENLRVNLQTRTTRNEAEISFS